MGFIPAGARWYIAEIILEHVFADDSRNVVHTNVHLIEATSPNEAFEKSMKLGKQSEQVYINTSGTNVRVVFRGLFDLNVVHDSLEDGAELFYREGIDVSEDRLKKMAARRDELSVFSTKEPNFDGPNLMPDSIGRLLLDLDLGLNPDLHHESGSSE